MGTMSKKPAGERDEGDCCYYTKGGSSDQMINAALTTVAPASICHLKRKGPKLVCVRIGEIEHLAYELMNPENPEESETVWVERLSTAEKF